MNRNPFAKYDVDNILADKVLEIISSEGYKTTFHNIQNVMKEYDYNSYYDAIQNMIEDPKAGWWYSTDAAFFDKMYQNKYKTYMTEYNHNLKKKVRHE